MPDLFFVVQGKAKLLTGGTVQDGNTVSPGEIRGKAVVNGVGTILNQGDIVHIPATVPINSCRRRELPLFRHQS